MGINLQVIGERVGDGQANGQDSGKMPRVGDVVTCHFKISLMDTTKVSDTVGFPPPTDHHHLLLAATFYLFLPSATLPHLSFSLLSPLFSILSCLSFSCSLVIHRLAPPALHTFKAVQFLLNQKTAPPSERRARRHGRRASQPQRFGPTPPAIDPPSPPPSLHTLRI